MAKKSKNPNHTKAINRKKIASEEMAQLGLTLDDNIMTIGFIFEHLGISHLTYLGFLSLNQLCRDFTGIDITFFSQHQSIPCVKLLCPVFNTSDLARWQKHPLVATNILTCLDALDTNASTIYHYAFDPEFINASHLPSSDLHKTFCDPRVKVIARHENHRSLIETEFGIKICDTIVPDCDAVTLVKLIVTEEKNAQQ